MRQGRDGSKQPTNARLSVVLDQELLEYVRIRAFEERKSKSAYVRDLVLSDVARVERKRK
jgi:hypothetical protein